MPAWTRHVTSEKQFIHFVKVHSYLSALVRVYNIGGGAIFLVGGETKIAEGISDAKNRRFVLYIAFSGKVRGYSPSPPPPPPPGSASHV